MSDDLQATYDDSFGHAFQSHILAVMLRVPGFILRYRTALSHEYFVDEAHREIAKAVLAHVDKYRELPVHATLEEAVRDATVDDAQEIALAALTNLYDDDIGDASAVSDRVVHFGRHQALVNAALDMSEDIDSGRHRGMDGYRRLRSHLDQAMLVGEDLLNLGVPLRGDDDRFAQYTQPQEESAHIPVGIPHFDYAMEGGLARGELGVILAPPKRGKTTALINIGFGAARAGFNVVHYSLEMRQEKVLEKYDDRLMGDLVALKKTDPEEYVERLRQKVDEEIEGNLYVQFYHTRTAGISTLRSHLSLLAAKEFTPDLVIVDYGDIMKPERRLGEMRHEQAGVYEDLRQFAGEYDVAVWTASQAGRAAMEADIVEAAHTSESFEKVNIADAVWSLCQTKEERVMSQCRLFGVALRDVADGRTVLCSIDRRKCYVQSVSLYGSDESDPIYIPGEVSEDGTVLSAEEAEDRMAESDRRKAKEASLKRASGISDSSRKRKPRKKSPDKNGASKTPKKKRGRKVSQRVDGD